MLPKHRFHCKISYYDASPASWNAVCFEHHRMLSIHNDQLDALQHRYDYRVGLNIREDAPAWANLRNRVRQEARQLVRDRTVAIRLDEQARADNASQDEGWAIRQAATMREEALIEEESEAILPRAITVYVDHLRERAARGDGAGRGRARGPWDA